jgi:hypothetical protein
MTNGVVITDNEMGLMWKKVTVAYFIYNLRIFLEGMRMRNLRLIGARVDIGKW